MNLRFTLLPPEGGGPSGCSLCLWTFTLLPLNLHAAVRIPLAGGELQACLTDFGMEPKRPLAARQLGMTMDFAQFMEVCGRYGYALVDSYKMTVGALHCFLDAPPPLPPLNVTA